MIYLLPFAEILCYNLNGKVFLCLSGKTRLKKKTKGK